MSLNTQTRTPFQYRILVFETNLEISHINSRYTERNNGLGVNKYIVPNYYLWF